MSARKPKRTNGRQTAASERLARATKTANHPAHTLKPNYCFGCGEANPEGMRLKFSVDETSHTARGIFSLPRKYQGSRKIAHGGIVALLLDEAMGKLNRIAGIVAPTAELKVEYLRPTPVGKKIIVEARAIEQQGRNYWRECTIRDQQGKLLVRGAGRFVKIDDRR